MKKVYCDCLLWYNYIVLVIDNYIVQLIYMTLTVTDYDTMD